ncbi:MAG: 50S ribosomal protein L2 [bacterium]
MPLKKYKPTSPGKRFTALVSNEELSRKRPEKNLTFTKKEKGGRNNSGKVCVHHRGGGHKRRVRALDFRRDKHGVTARVASIEYDPNRSARIALLHYADGEKRYVIAPKGLSPGDIVASGPDVDITTGSALPLSEIPLGSLIHNIEMRPGGGARIARSAGVFAQVIAKEGAYCHVRLPSGEIRLFQKNCSATMGQVGNEEHSVASIGKAGRKRWKGRRPSVRGTVMNPCDHPHGGGEGKNKSAGRNPVSPWGVPAKGGKTRNPRKSNKMIVSKRKKK